MGLRLPTASVIQRDPYRNRAYLMAKPDAAARQAACWLRARLGFDSTYDAARLHVTLLPLCSGDDLTPALLSRIEGAIAGLSAEPFPIRFHRVSGNALAGGPAREVRRFQRDLMRCLVAGGVVVPRYEFRPHLSLCYGNPRPFGRPIQPIGWQVEELLLVESIYGQKRHELIRSWPLMKRQETLPF